MDGGRGEVIAGGPNAAARVWAFVEPIVYSVGMVTSEELKSAFEAGLAYDAYVATGKDDQRASWAAFAARVALTEAQRSLIRGFTRQLNVLVISGTWCGDCVQQVPMIEAIAKENPRVVRTRYIDRDEHASLAKKVTICGGMRVPTALFLNEDFEFCGLAGDKSLSRLRAIAARSLGASCPLPGAPVPADEIAATLADWVADVERMHLLVRLSAKLRQRHND